MPFDVASLRSQFPALTRHQNGRPIAYFDGPAGTQVPQSVADAVAECLLHHNANSGGPFATSSEADEILDAGRRAMADLLGATDPDEIAFGQNMTSLTLAASRAIGCTWQPGDEVIVSRLDHDANVTPWVLAARDAGATVKHIDINRHDCTLDLGSFEAALSERTKLVAVGYASNAVGTINPVQHITARAKSVGALTWIDAVHYTPHGSIDVQATGCDFLVCSAYKFFGPHVGILWGRRDLLESLQPYKLRPSSDDLPGRWMTGTQSHEGIAGVTAAVEYLARIGVSATREGGRRASLLRAFESIVAYERELGERLIAGLQRLPGFKIWGITQPDHFRDRVPTVSVTHVTRTPQEIATTLAEQGLYLWPGNHYALPVTETLALEPHGTLRIGLVHYNTADEVDRLLDALTQFA
jgi:cysteine desulfurase family protein (TIGR01976 family)